MKIIKLLALCAVLITLSTEGINAQKFGHMNSGNLISMMPDTKVADATLKDFQSLLLANTEKLQKSLDVKANNLKLEIDNGTLTKKEAEARYVVLQTEQNNIIKMQQADQKKLLQKRDEIMLPLLSRVEKAVQEVGKENNYEFIFDTSIFNAILYVKESDDITPMVKAKLGL